MNFNLKRRSFLKFAGLSCLAISLDAFIFERLLIRRSYFNLTKSSIEKIKIIQLSDLHLNSIHLGHRHLVNKVNSEKAKLICFTGDFIDKQNNIELAENFLKLLDLEVQKVAILGNWEYWGKVDLQKLKQIYEKYNCTLLINQQKQFIFQQRIINIIGFDDLLGGKPDYNLISNSESAENFNIVLAHCPASREQISEAAKINIEFILSGHTHGGQINFLGKVPFLPRGCGKYIKGWYENDQLIKMYVSRGIGTSILPVRFGSPAEYVVLEI